MGNAPVDKTLKQTLTQPFEQALAEHGATPSGVSWRNQLGVDLRFEALSRVFQNVNMGTLLDYGCGYGALFDYLQANDFAGNYTGYDLSPTMTAAAQARCGSTPLLFTDFCNELTAECSFDYVVASGIFNIRNAIDDATWHCYILDTLQHFNQLAKKGFAFNLCTSYSSPDKRKPEIYYANPCELFDYCKQHFSRNVALLHDYDLYEFTLIVKKEYQDVWSSAS
jgi:SAM-dependent methyltransferase